MWIWRKCMRADADVAAWSVVWHLKWITIFNSQFSGPPLTCLLFSSLSRCWCCCCCCVIASTPNFDFNSFSNFGYSALLGLTAMSFKRRNEWSEESQFTLCLSLAQTSDESFSFAFSKKRDKEEKQGIINHHNKFDLSKGKEKQKHWWKWVQRRLRNHHHILEPFPVFHHKIITRALFVSAPCRF